MSKLIKRASEHSGARKEKYHQFGLEENPFPSAPFINRDNPDVRYNGQIYEVRIREAERQKIVENFLAVPQSDPNRLRLGYILDSSYVGRGNGKSAFVVNLVEEINEHFCSNFSQDANVCFGLQLSPEPSGRTKTFANFVDLLFDAIVHNGLIKHSLASLRLEAIKELNSALYDQLIVLDYDELVAELNSDELYQKSKISIADLAKVYRKNDFVERLPSSFPLFYDNSKFYSYSVVKEESFVKYYFHELRKGRERYNFIFSDLVNFFRASGFNGAFVFVDDFERIPDFQSGKQKQEFALELRSNFFDGSVVNASEGFYNMILVLHAGVPRLLQDAWDVTGMDRRAPMIGDGDGERHMVKFEKLTSDHAVLLMERYLNEFRVDDRDSSLHPFSREAVVLLAERSELNASLILEKAHILIEKAADDNLKELDVKAVEELFNNTLVDVREKGTDLDAQGNLDLTQEAKKSKE